MKTDDLATLAYSEEHLYINRSGEFLHDFKGKTRKVTRQKARAIWRRAYPRARWEETAKFIKKWVSREGTA